MTLVVDEMNIKIHKESTCQDFFKNVILKKSNCCVSVTGKRKKWGRGEASFNKFSCSQV